MSTLPLRSLLDFALDAAWQAGRITLGYFQAGVAAERKADNSPVTIADRLAEQKLRELIGRYWPDHGIIGEELGHKRDVLTPPGSSTRLTGRSRSCKGCRSTPSWWRWPTETRR